MAHRFTCLKCGQALTQDTVVFDLLNGADQSEANGLTLCLTEKELKHIWKKKRKWNRYVVELSWKSFFRYAGNGNNMNAPSLQELIYSPKPDKIKAQCDGLGLEKKRVMQAINRVFPAQSGSKQKRAPTFYREVVPEYENGILVGLKVYKNGSGENGESVPRRCNRRACGAQIPKWAGVCRHHTVVMIGPEGTDAAESETQEGTVRKKICREITDFILQYKNQKAGEWDMGEWIADPEGEHKQDFQAITLKLMRKGDRARYLTLALVPQKDGKYLVKDGFFADADAYLLCERNQEETQEIDEKMLICLETLQKQRVQWLKFTDGFEGWVPALCVYHTKDRIAESPDKGKKDIFPADRGKANKEAFCAQMRIQLEHRNIECYYTQLFYSDINSADSIKKAVKWILHVTGWMPVSVEMGEKNEEKQELYHITPPICKQCLPSQPVRKQKVGSLGKWCDLCQEEAKARMYLFDNADENWEVAEAKNDPQLCWELLQKGIVRRIKNAGK